MPSRAGSALLLASALLGAPAAQAAQPAATPPAAATNFTNGVWHGGPVTDNDGRAQACAMFASVGGGMELFFRLSSNFDFSLGLVNRRWNFSENALMPMSYRIDGGAQVQVQARATRSDTILIEVSDRESIFQAFRHGLWLYLATQGANARFSLKGTSVALEQLRTCATTLAAANPQEPQPAPPAPPPPAPPPRPAPGK
jgi:hypothetical protein